MVDVLMTAHTKGDTISIPLEEYKKYREYFTKRTPFTEEELEQCKEKEYENRIKNLGINLTDDENFCLSSYCYECCVCHYLNHCYAGNGDNDFILADKEEIVRRIQNKIFDNDKEFMIRVLKAKYDYIYEEK